MAASVPVPMARPRSAWARAAASLTPSPTMATTRPSSWRRRTTATLSAGRTSAITSSIPTAAATARAARSLSPVSSTGRRPEAAQLADRLGRGRLHRVGDDEHGADLAVPAGGDGGAPRRLRGRLGCFQLGRQVQRPVGEQLGPPGDDGVTVDDALHAEALAVLEGLDGGQGAEPLPGGAGDGLGDGVLGGVLHGADEAQHLGLVDVRRW